MYKLIPQTRRIGKLRPDDTNKCDQHVVELHHSANHLTMSKSEGGFGHHEVFKLIRFRRRLTPHSSEMNTLNN